MMEENNQITETKKVYEFRKLNGADIPLMLKILTKVNMKKFASLLENETVVGILSGKGADENEDKNGLVTGGIIILEVAQIIFEGLGDCEEIFEMLHKTSNLSLKEVKALDFEVLMEMIIDFIKKEEFVGFLKVASKLIR